MSKWQGATGLMKPEMVYKYAKQGLTLTEIGNFYGCGKSNVSQIINNNPELKAAWDKGHGELLLEYTGQLKKRAMESDIMLMFALKTQCGYCEEQHKIGKELNKDNHPAVHIYLPSNGRDEPDNNDE